MELSSKVVPATTADSTSTTDATDSDSSSDDPIIIISFDEDSSETAVDEDGNPIEDGTTGLGGSLGGVVSGDGDSDDEWYDPLSFTQITGIFIATGFVIIGGGIMAAVMIYNRKKNAVVIHEPIIIQQFEKPAPFGTTSHRIDSAEKEEIFDASHEAEIAPFVGLREEILTPGTLTSPVNELAPPNPEVTAKASIPEPDGYAFEE